MTVCYLDADDEITTAVARLRDAEDSSVLLVLPPGSRIGTSRINFRLLAAEAQARGRELAVATPDRGVRSLAATAGIAAYPSVAEYEAALREPASAAGVAGVPSAEPHPEREVPPVFPALPPETPLPPTAARRRRRPGLVGLDRRTLRWAAALAVLLLLIGAGVAAAVVLPSARITVTPVTTAAGPVVVEVVADPNAPADDPAAGIVRAERLEIPLEVSDRFAATGRDVVLTRATGRVRFTSENTLFDVTVPSGTEVSTQSGIRFVTTDSVVVPKASFSTGRTTADAPVQAVEGGPAGNVAANTITREPATLRAALVSVNNPQPTGGGTRTETPFVSQSDYDAAMRQLARELDQALEPAVGARAERETELMVHPDTAARGRITPEPAEGDVVGRRGATSFELALRATGSVTAVRESDLEPLAEARLRESQDPGYTIFPGSVRVEVGQGRVDGAIVRYSLQARGEQSRALDAAALLAEVKGRPVDEARRLLSRYGRVEIEIWPSFIDAIPTFDPRVSLVVGPPQRPAS
jgi:hypothetical protein